MKMNIKGKLTCAAACTACLLSSADTLVWTGAASSSWNLTDANWTNETGVVSAWVNGSTATFTAGANSAISVTDDIQLRDLTMTATCPALTWNDGGGSLTFVSDVSNPTNYITLRSQNASIYARVSCAAPLVKQGSGVLSLHNDNNNFVGGIYQSTSQLRFSTSGAVGSGPVYMLGNSTAFCEVGAAAPDAKFVQSGSNNLLGSLGSLLTVKSVGVTADNVTREFHIGRGANACAVALSLTDPESEGIGQYFLHGSGSSFSFDGGTVTASPEAKDPFFRVADGAKPAVRVTNNGVTFDTAGANTELGLKLSFDNPMVITNVVQTVEPTNWSFETGSLSPWAQNKGSNTGETSSSQSNDSAFMKVNNESRPYYYTTNGTHFAVVRRGHTISQTVSLPSAGLWRVVYERGCRPDSGYPSQGFEVTVTLGDPANATVSPAQEDKYTFRREETSLFQLGAGSHNLSFAVSDDTRGMLAVFLDAIRLERCEITSVPRGPIIKTGDGSLTITNLVTDGLVAVSNGTLTVKESVLDGTIVNVASGGALELYATRLTNATVNVAAGGTLTLRDGNGKNLIVNGSFEDDNVSGYSIIAPGSGPTGWLFSQKDSSTESLGIQVNGSAISANGFFTKYGRTTAVMRKNTELSQIVTVPADGIYEVSFLHGCRYGYNSYRIPLTLLVDGIAVASNGTPTADYDFVRSTARVNLSAGEHTLVFSTDNATVSYAALFIDDVRLVSTIGANALDGNTLALMSGATLDLQNAEPIYLAGGITVNGQAVKGSANALRRAGVTVTGGGKIQIGPPQGTKLIVR